MWIQTPHRRRATRAPLLEPAATHVAVPRSDHIGSTNATGVPASPADGPGARGPTIGAASLSSAIGDAGTMAVTGGFA